MDDFDFIDDGDESWTDAFIAGIKAAKKEQSPTNDSEPVKTTPEPE